MLPTPSRLKRQFLVSIRSVRVNLGTDAQCKINLFYGERSSPTQSVLSQSFYLPLSAPPLKMSRLSFPVPRRGPSLALWHCQIMLVWRPLVRVPKLRWFKCEQEYYANLIVCQFRYWPALSFFCDLWDFLRQRTGENGEKRQKIDSIEEGLDIGKSKEGKGTWWSRERKKC